MNPNHVLASDVTIVSVGKTYQRIHNPKELKNPDGDVYYRTDLPDGYSIEGLPGFYLLGSIGQRQSNLNIITLSLVGENGVKYCHDTLDTNKAIRTVSKMKSAAIVDYESIGAIYVGE